MRNGGGLLIPERPVFQTESERRVWEKLAESLAPGEVLIHGLRFTDPQSGDVEIDLLLLSPTRGAAIVEVKGGHVEFRDGEWFLTNRKGGSRRIHPTDQARRAKHALRRYLDRHPEWEHGLLRSQWFLAFPRTTVNGDIGPEAPRALVIGRDDLSRAREIIDDGLARVEREPQVPPEGWVEQVVQLMLDAPEATVSDGRFAQAAEATGLGAHDGLVLSGIVLGSLAVAAIGVLVGGLWGLIPAGLVTVGVVTVGFTLLRGKGSRRLPVAVALACAGCVAGGFGVWGALSLLEGDSTMPVVSAETSVRLQEEAVDPATLDCHSAYLPCVLKTEWDRDCADIGFKVTIIGDKDPYRLDRDGSGVGCESYPESLEGERITGR